MKLWRAADDGNLSAGMSLSQKRADAEAYLDNPGFGGRRLWSIDIHPKYVLDLSGEDEQAANSDITDLIDADEHTSDLITQGFPSVGVMLANVRGVEDALAELYDWVVFRDDFPEDAVTWWYLGDKDLRLKAVQGGPMPNPWLAHGWVLPDGQYIPVAEKKDHKSVAASILRMRDKSKAFDRALRERWVRVGEATIQLPSPPDNSAFLRARDHVRETSPAGQDWDIRIEWWSGNDVVSYQVPISEFMEMDDIGDLARYPKAVW